MLDTPGVPVVVGLLLLRFLLLLPVVAGFSTVRYFGQEFANSFDVFFRPQVDFETVQDHRLWGWQLAHFYIPGKSARP